MSALSVNFLQQRITPATLRLQASILRRGLVLRLHGDLGGLCAWVSETGASHERLVLVAGSQELLCVAARSVRQRNSAIPVVGLLEDYADAHPLQVLDSGVDACWPLAASPGMIAESLLRLGKGGREGGESSAAPATVAQGSCWWLESDGWVARSGNVRIELSAAERALVMALYRAPNYTQSHLELVRALVECQWPQGQPGTLPASVVVPAAAARRLSVLVSRMRAKFEEAGAQMPIRSLRGFGYALKPPAS